MKGKNILKEFLNYPLASGNLILERFSELEGSVRRGEGSEQFVYLRGKRENKVLLVAGGEISAYIFLNRICLFRRNKGRLHLDESNLAKLTESLS